MTRSVGVGAEMSHTQSALPEYAPPTVVVVEMKGPTPVQPTGIKRVIIVNAFEQSTGKADRL